MRFHILLLALVLHQNCLVCNAYPPTYSEEPPAVGDSGGGGKDALTSSVKYITKSRTRAVAAVAEASPSSLLLSTTSAPTSNTTTTTAESLPSASQPLHVQSAFVYEAALPTQEDSTATAAVTAERDGESSKKIIGSSVVTSVSVILNGNEPQFMDAIGVKVPKPLPSLQVASPINLLNPDRYEFYTFDDNGELVKRLMTLQEIQSIVANGDGEGPSIIHTAPILERDPEKNVQDIVNSVQNVLNKQVESNNNSSAVNAVPPLDTPDVSSSWSMILPAIFGNTGGDIFPPQRPQHINMTPDSDLLETSTKQPTLTSRRPKPPKRKPSQKRKTTTSTTEMPQTPQVVQEELSPNESVYTGMEQYQSIASNMQDFDAFTAMNMQPIYHKIPPSEPETTTRRVFVNNQEVIQTPAPSIVKTDELPEASVKKPTNSQHKHAPPHRRRPGATGTKQKIKKKPHVSTTTRVPPTPTPVVTTTPIPTTTTTTPIPTTTTTTPISTTTTTTTTPAPTTTTTTPPPTTLEPEVITITAATATTPPPKKKKKPTRHPIHHYLNGSSAKPHLGSQKRKPHPQSTPHPRPRPTHASQQVQQQEQTHHQQQEQNTEELDHQQQAQHHQQQAQHHLQQAHHHQQQAQHHQQQDQQPQQLHHPTQLKEHQQQHHSKPQDQHPQQDIDKHPSHDSMGDSTLPDHQHINHHKQRPRPTKISTTTKSATTTSSTTPAPTATTPAALAVDPQTTTTSQPIEASLVVASYSDIESSSATAQKHVLHTFTPISAYPVPVFDFSHSQQPQTSLISGSEETNENHLKINQLLSLSMIQQQQLQQHHQPQMPLIHSDEDLNTKLSFDQIMLSLKQDDSKGMEKPKEEEKLAQEKIQQSEILPVKYDSAENIHSLEEMAEKLKKPISTNIPPTLHSTLDPSVTPEISPGSLLLNSTADATTVSPIKEAMNGEPDSTKLDDITTVTSEEMMKPIVKVTDSPQQTSSNEEVHNAYEQAAKPVVKVTKPAQLPETTTQEELTTEQLETITNLPQLITSKPTPTTRVPEMTTTKAQLQTTTKPEQLTTMTPPASTFKPAATTSDLLLELETTKLNNNVPQTDTSEHQENQQAPSLEQKPSEDQLQVVHYEPLYAEVQEPILTELTTIATDIPEAQTSSYETEDSNAAEPASKTDLSIDDLGTSTELLDAEAVTATTNANLRLPVYVNIPQEVEALIAEKDSQTELPQFVDLVQHLSPNIVQPTEKISMTEFQTQAATVASTLVGGSNTSVATDAAMSSSEKKDELEFLMSDVIQQITNDQQTYKLPPVEETSNRLSNFAQFNTSFLLRQGAGEVLEEKPQSNEDSTGNAEETAEILQEVEVTQPLPNNLDTSSNTSIKSTTTAEHLAVTTTLPSKEEVIKQNGEQTEMIEVTTQANEEIQVTNGKLATSDAAAVSEQQKDKFDVGDEKEKLNKTPTTINQPPTEQLKSNPSIEPNGNAPNNQLESIEISTPSKFTYEVQSLEKSSIKIKASDEENENIAQKKTEKLKNTEELKDSELSENVESSTDKRTQDEINNDSTAESSQTVSETSTENSAFALISDGSAITETSQVLSVSDDETDEVVSTDKISSVTSYEQLKSEESNESQSNTEEEDNDDAITKTTKPQLQYTTHPSKENNKEEKESLTTNPPPIDLNPALTEKPQTEEEEVDIIASSTDQNSAVISPDSDVSANVELVSSLQQLESDSVEESTELPTKIAAFPALTDSSTSEELTTEDYENQLATETSTDDEITAIIADNDQLQESIDEDPYLKLGELTAKPIVVKLAEQASNLPATPSMKPEEEQTNFQHMENNYEALANGHHVMQNNDSTSEPDEEDEEDQDGFEETTKNMEISSSTSTTTQRTSTPQLSSTTSTTTTTQKPLMVSTTAQPTTTSTSTTTKRMNTLKPVSYYKQPAFNAYNQPETPQHQTYSNLSPLAQQLQQRPMQRPPALSNLMHASSQATRPPVKLEPSPGHSKGLEASVANLDEDLLQFGQLCNELAFSYWKSITSEKISSARSLIISPFALTAMLSMVFLGARGGTSGEMNEVLRLDDMVTFNPHLVFKNITESVEKATDSDIATAAFVREVFSDRSNGKILQFFKEKTQQLYSGHVEEVNFHVVNDIIRRRTNLLIKRHTMGKVLEYLRTNSVWVNGPLATISANLFQTDCKHGSTNDRDGEMFFQVHPSVRQRRLVPIPAVLYKSGFTAGYEPKLDATVVAFGRIEDTVSTIYVMPGHQSSISPVDNLDRLEKELIDLAFSSNAWSNVLTSVMDRPGMEVQLPRFSHRSFINASLGLQKMGLKGLFKSDFADLRGLTGSSNRDIYLSDMIQINTFSTCGEEKISDHHHVEMYPAPPLRKRNKDVDSNDEDDFDSSEAIIDFGSLVQESALGRGFYDDLLDPKFLELPLPLRPRQARVPDTPRLRFDKPFLYFVRHNPTGMILFMGRFNPRLLP